MRSLMAIPKAVCLIVDDCIRCRMVPPVQMGLDQPRLLKVARPPLAHVVEGTANQSYVSCKSGIIDAVPDKKHGSVP